MRPTTAPRLPNRARHLAALASTALLALAAVAPPGVAAAPNDHAAATNPHTLQHVFEIMMENTGYASLIGNPNAPWINRAAARYGIATDYYGVTHPSQPNYIAATSGSTNGVTSDSDTTVSATNIVDELESAGKTWKAYMQSYSLCTLPTDSACGNSLYERKHNPFISYTDIASSPARVANIVDLSQLSTDLANNTVPDYSWISPDQCHDMHGRGTAGTDPCSYDNEQQLIAAGDAFLAQTVGAIMSSRAWTPGSVIFITWDESDYTGTGPAGFGDTSGCCDANPGGGHVVTLVIAHTPDGHRVSSNPYNHYSILATIEDSWQLGKLGYTSDTANVPPMTDLTGLGH